MACGLEFDTCGYFSHSHSVMVSPLSSWCNFCHQCWSVWIKCRNRMISLTCACVELVHMCSSEVECTLKTVSEMEWTQEKYYTRTLTVVWRDVISELSSQTQTSPKICCGFTSWSCSFMLLNVYYKRGSIWFNWVISLQQSVGRLVSATVCYDQPLME